ncbi:unnamed protein product [Sympodiomycopsis kandeliae]
MVMSNGNIDHIDISFSQPAMTTADPSNNLTLKVLNDAAKGNYAVVAQSCYDTQSVLALIAAAEKARSPVIAQLFPVTMKQFGIHFVRFVIEACHAATVPIAVHVDHAATDEDITRVLDFAEAGAAVDSIMIDCSHHDTDEDNIAAARPHCQRAHKLGLAVEIELGRLTGGEDGVQNITEGALTDPSKAQHFMTKLGAQLLAPSIGNIHGRYKQPPNFHLDLLDSLQAKVDGLLVLHGTDDLPDDLFRSCVQKGCVKMNLNSWCRDPQVRYWSDNISKLGLPDLYDGGMAAFEHALTRFFDLLQSANQG